ncbi:Mechanosensitive ion channel [Chitinophaga terrae (ex Kim and Jung 2007)]|uniref:Mechanosensitive ion channel n=1 Tax=Chitinophaga terrae (ex Kim and Jung 2007) TaxID=408074 RepID=A0A1H4ABV7_9BACT|nr:mechanosensitive ion channel domain-containing protein [Chitinophaga terrae (ex Kim and Jung 2007)]GEP90152.1 hypothetical protein CTE07_17970 [Chitinophaga terrae (ex Kim and Jung 2007)]SEA33248.1 Mechanosensitive ion channel [Chitinophaga terrae (ex Kim and Jung 2007)]
MKIYITIVIAFLLPLLHGNTVNAQQRKKKQDTLHLVAIDSATISKNIAALAKDTTKVRKSDTAVAILINRIESYTLLMNDLMSTLRRGFDTLGISEGIPVADTSLALVKRNIASLGRTPNINDIYTNKVMLEQLQRKLDNWQSTLFSYYNKLVAINDTLHSLRRDTAMRNIPSEDELYGFYLGQVTNMVLKYRGVDSANSINLIRMGLLQNKVANRYIETSNLYEDMEYRLNQYSRHMFVRDYRYLWRPHKDSINPLEFFPVLKNSINKNTKVLAIFFSIQWPIFLVWILIASLFLWWIFNNIRRIKNKHPEQEAETILQHSKYVYRFPIASAVVLISTLSAVLSIRYPTLFTEITWAINVLALTVIFRQQLPKTMYRSWCFALCLLAFYCLANLIIEVTYAEQWALLIAAILGIILGYRMLKESGTTTYIQPKFARPLIRLFIGTCMLSVLLVLLSIVGTAKVMGTSAIVNMLMAVSLYVLVQIIMEAVFLQVEANKDSSSFISFMDFQDVQRKLKTFLSILSVVGWLIIVSRNLYLYDSIYDFISARLQERHKIGTSDFTLSSVIIFVVVIWISTVASQLIAYMFGNTGQNANKKTKLGSALLLLRLAVLAGGVLIAFAASGIPMDKLTIVIGALGVGIGFGLQNIVNNLVSGVILAFEKPIEVGDVIEIGPRSGVVKEVGIRSSKISLYDGSEVIVPNGDLISQQLVNWTRTNRNKRVTFTISVAYGSDIKQVIDIIQSAFVGKKEIMSIPAPLAQLSDFGDNAINFKVYFWVSDLDYAGSQQSEALAFIYDALNKAGIEIPYPQRDLHIRSLDESLLDRLGKKGPAPEA